MLGVSVHFTAQTSSQHPSTENNLTQSVASLPDSHYQDLAFSTAVEETYLYLGIGMGWKKYEIKNKKK